MRHKESKKIKEMCVQSIPTVFKRLGLGTVSKIVEDVDGWVNPCFFVNNKYAVRFNARDPELPKFQREKIIYDLLLERGFPVPSNVILDDSMRDVGYDILISSLLPGKNLEAVWPDLSKADRARVAVEVGATHRKMHDVIEFDFFGEIASFGPFGRHEKWSGYLSARMNYLLVQSNNLGLLTEAQQEGVKSLFDEFSWAFDEVKKSNLVHADYHLGNLLVQDGLLSGVLDFEWSFGGDSLYDLGRWILEDEVCPESRSPFLSGYGFESLNESEKVRLDFYQVLKNVELCIVANLHYSDSEAEDYHNTTVEHILMLLDKTGG